MGGPAIKTVAGRSCEVKPNKSSIVSCRKLLSKLVVDLVKDLEWENLQQDPLRL